MTSCTFITRENEMDEYKRQEIYTTGFKDGYAQAIAEADEALKKLGDNRVIRQCRQSVLALAGVSYNPSDVSPMPYWAARTDKR